MKHRFLFCFFITAAIVFIKGCGDDIIQPTGGNSDPGIYMTDEFGNFLGGDTTDWCLQSDTGMASVFSFGAPYPNPTNGNIFHVRLSLPAADSIKIFFIKGSNDSIMLANNYLNAGIYSFTYTDSTNQFANSYQRLYLRGKRFTESQYCRFYGDIKFTP